MLQFILSCLLLLSILLWWAEAKYNFLYGLVMWFKDGCDWFKKQTKLKIDLCKWFLPCIFIFGAIYTLYYPYFKQTLEFKQGAFVIRDYSKEGEDKELVQKKVSENIENEEQANPIGDWGTFGDFIGGTLNPLIGLISVFLLFATWKLTSNTFKSTDTALKYQQFDSWFFNLLESFQSISNKYEDYVKQDDFYKKLFIDKQPNLALSRNVLMIQYFSSLHVLLNTLNTKLSFIEEKKERNEKKSFYLDIILSKVSGDILQIIAWYAFQDKKLKKELEESGFFKNIDFKCYKDGNNELFSDYNFVLLLNLHRYDEKIFDNSRRISELKKTYIYPLFFKNGACLSQYFKDQYRKEISLQLSSGISGKWNLSLTFTQDGLVVREIDATQLSPQIVEYKEMIFDDFKIKIIVVNFFEIILPQGNISKIEIKPYTSKCEKVEII